jgi:hypothetical protein
MKISGKCFVTIIITEMLGRRVSFSVAQQDKHVHKRGGEGSGAISFSAALHYYTAMETDENVVKKCPL